jgi:phosphoribosylamine---glycine ligase
MNILLLGAGGREHALAWKIAQSKLCSQLFIAPGNPGTAKCGTNVNIAVTDFEGIHQLCKSKKISLVIVGPEEPLVKGIYDFFENTDVKVIGPSLEGAKLEGSKVYAKAFMTRHNIPTAAYREFDETNFDEGLAYLKNHALPIVLKADGLAAGKGVIICQNYVEANAEFELMIQQSKFGEASKRVVVEEFLDGIELSMFALTDGKEYVILPEAKDYKRIGENDKGLNTGGMGAISPVPFADEVFMKKVEDKIIRPTIEGLHKENIKYTGFVFFGLIKVGNEPWVIEYNCRMGDPETEVVMPRLKTDVVELFIAAVSGHLAAMQIEQDKRAACTVMAVSGGYPGNYEKGFVIEGLNRQTPDSIVFHAGTTQQGNNIVTSGGRVLCVTSFGENIEEAVYKSREVLEEISYEGMYYRRDIGYEFIDS